ncbi:DUF4105 domain-containing protein [Gaetbulibacter sp. M235]|uniref:Lnb N-terminal periplasmic domain-containing protein n=1 Tax=Gaetbulibacter sp. M235 TaxID=3126510 RepID=UPI00374E3D39
MFKKLLFTACFFCLTFTFSQNYKLSPDTEISIITVGPGNSLNDAFGHNAIRIQDASGRLDVCFDYGRFDFDAPNFYLNFARGKLNYSIGAVNYYDFIRFYEWQNRTVEEQKLNLNQEQKQKLYEYLVNNYKPENRNYLYDFFYDNCATKIKEVLDIATNNALKYNNPKDFKAETFRTLIQNKLNRNSWGSLGIDVALGSVIDQKATPEEHMFLPSFIHAFFDVATFKSSNEPLVKESNTVYKEKPTPKSGNFFLSPLFVFGIIGVLILFITYKDFKKNQRTKSLDIILFLLTGIIGALIVLLWFATDHKATHQNYNLLWACVLNLLVIKQVFKTRISPWFIKYLKFLVILLCLLTLHWVIGVQIFAIGLIPFLVALFIRYIYLIKYYNQHLLPSEVEQGR